MSSFSRWIGASRVLSIPMVVLSLLACPASGELDLDSLLVHSIGGAAALETVTNFNSIHTYGQIDLNGMQGTFASILVPPTYYYQEADFGAFRFVQAYDGPIAWQADHNGFISELSGEERKELVRSVFFESYSYLIPDRIPGNAWYVGESELDNVLFQMIAFVIEPADTVVVFYDTKSGLPRRMVSRTDNTQSVALADDFREVNSLSIAFHVLAAAVDAPQRSEFFVDSVVLDAPVDMSVFEMQQNRLSDYRLPPDVDAVIIPFKYKAGHIFVAARINGVRQVWLLLDSGASANILSAVAVADLDLKVVGSVPAQGVAGYEEVQLVRVDSLNIGDLCLLGQVSGTLDMTALDVNCPPGTVFGGVLGHDFLSRFPVLVNYHDSSLTVFNPETFVKPSGGSEMSFRVTRNIPVIEAELDGLVGEYLIDLGNAIGLVIHPEYAERHNLVEQLGDIREADGLFAGVGGAVGGRKARAKSFKFGDVSIDSPEVFVPDAADGVTGSVNLAGNIGKGILERFNVLFDYAHQKVIFYQP